MIKKKIKIIPKYNQIRIELGALATGMFYSAQDERKNAFNRIRQIVYRKTEKKQLTEKSKKKKDKDKARGKFSDKELIKQLNKVKLKKEEKEYVSQMIGLLEEMRKKENGYKKLMAKYIEQEPIYDKWLKDVRGIGTLNTANLLQYFGYCEKAKHCSSLWKFAGFHVVDGKAPKPQKGKTLDYNPKLRMLIYRIGDCFVKTRSPVYRDIYDREKKLQLDLMEKKTGNFPKSLLHADLRARRKMVKKFLADYYAKCLLLRGIKAEPVYSHRKD